MQKWWPKCLEENIPNSAVSIVSADGLAQWGTMKTKLRSCIDTWMHGFREIQDTISKGNLAATLQNFNAASQDSKIKTYVVNVILWHKFMSYFCVIHKSSSKEQFSVMS